MQAKQITQTHSAPEKSEGIGSNEQNSKNQQQPPSMIEQSIMELKSESGQSSSRSQINQKSSKHQMLNTNGSIQFSLTNGHDLGSTIEGENNTQILNQEHLSTLNSNHFLAQELDFRNQISQEHQQCLNFKYSYSNILENIDQSNQQSQRNHSNQRENLLNSSNKDPINLIQREDFSLENNESYSIVLNGPMDQEFNVNDEQNQGEAQNEFGLGQIESRLRQRESRLRQNCESQSIIDKRSNLASNCKDSEFQILEQQLLQLFNHSQGQVELIKSIISRVGLGRFDQKRLKQYYRQIKLKQFVQKQIKQNLLTTTQFDLYQKFEPKLKLINQQEEQKEINNFKYLLCLDHWILKKNNNQECLFDQILKYEWDGVSVLIIKGSNLFTDDNWKQLTKCSKFKNLKVLWFRSNNLQSISYQQLRELKQNTQLRYIKFDHFISKLSMQSQLQIWKYCNQVDQEIIIQFLQSDQVSINYFESIDLNLIFKPLSLSNKIQLENIKKLNLKKNNINSDGFKVIVQNISILKKLSALDLSENKITQINQQDLIKLYVEKLKDLKNLKQNNQITKVKSETNQLWQQRCIYIQQLIINLQLNQLQQQSYLLIQRYSLLSLKSIIKFQYTFNEQFSLQKEQKKNLLKQYYQRNCPTSIIDMIFLLIVNKQPTIQLKQLMINQIPKAVKYQGTQSTYQNDGLTDQ